MVSKKTDRKFVTEFSAVVENNIANDAFSVEDICNEMNISRVQLYRKVKALMDCNVNDYINSTRLQKAKYYLQHEQLSISEVAFKTGFSSATYFSTAFKNKFGLTPTEFKDKKQNTNV
jgi:AraC-like DNA-binding protein